MRELAEGYLVQLYAYVLEDTLENRSLLQVREDTRARMPRSWTHFRVNDLKASHLAAGPVYV